MKHVQVLALALCATPLFAESRTVSYCNQSSEDLYLAVQHSWSSEPDPVFGSSTGYDRTTG